MTAAPTPDARPRRRALVIVGVAALVLALIAAVAVWFASRPAPGPETDVVQATRSDEQTTVSLSGILAPRQQARVSFAVPGTIRTVDVKVGDRVQLDQPLASLEERDLRSAVTLAEAQAAAARAQLQTVLDAGQASSAQIMAARAGVESADASLAQAQDRLSDAVLTSPLAGVVAEVMIEVGDQVSGNGALGSLGSLGTSGGMPGMAGLPGLGGLGAGPASSTTSGASIVVVVPDAWQLEAQVGTVDLPLLARGQDAVVTPTGTSQHVAATVDSVGIVASTASGQAATFPVTLAITDDSAELFSGSNADAVITTDVARDVLTVPTAALWPRDGKSFVRIPEGPGHREVEVTTGRRFGERIEITDGLRVGDAVLAKRGVVVTAPPRPQFGPGGTLASPDAQPDEDR